MSNGNYWVYAKADKALVRRRKLQGMKNAMSNLLTEHREQRDRMVELETCLAALMYWMDKIREGDLSHDQLASGLNSCWEKCTAVLAEREG